VTDLRLQYLIRSGQGAARNLLRSARPTLSAKLYTTYLASSFRTLLLACRFHAKAWRCIQYFLDKGAFVADADGTFSVDLNKIKDAVPTGSRSAHAGSHRRLRRHKEADERDDGAAPECRKRWSG